MSRSMKNAIVIGASSGIGEEFAKLLSKEGYRVGIAARRGDVMQKIAEENHINAVIREMDIAKPSEARGVFEEMVRVMTEEAKEDEGVIDMVVIASGVGKSDSMGNWEVSKWTNEVNVMGFTAIADASVALFKKQKVGKLVGFGSIAGLRGMSGAPVYSASKGYTVLYLEAARQYFVSEGMKGVSVTAVLPGFVDTPMVRGNEGMFWVAPVEKAVRQTYRAIMKGKFYVVITRRWRLIARLLKCLPRFVWFRVKCK